MRRHAFGLLIVVGACSTRVGPPASAAVPVSLQGGEAAIVKPTEEQIAYGNMAAIAMRQSRFLTSLMRVGLYQGEDPRAPLYPIVKIVLDQSAYQEIHQGQTKVACTMPQRPGLRGTRGTTPTCGLDRVDVLLQMTSVQIMRDSGYVGGYITQVFKDEDRPRTLSFCFIAVWRGEWIDVKNSMVKEPRDCAADRKH
jgi:hypothetical protein